MLENKICGFNVNEFHLVTMIMPYIYEKVNEGKVVSTFFEKDVQEIYNKVLNINEVFWKNKEKLDKIDWNKTNSNNLPEKFEKEADIVIVAGKKEYIDKINSLVINFHTKFTLVNCFPLVFTIHLPFSGCSILRSSTLPKVLMFPHRSTTHPSFPGYGRMTRPIIW